jgi:HK97 family phage portal protein
MNWFQRAAYNFAQAAAKIAFPGYGGGRNGRSGWYGYRYTPGTNIDYAKEIGDPWANSAVFNCLRWIMTTITEPRLTVVRVRGRNKNTEVEGHPLTEMLRRPNGEYSGKTLLKATSLSWNVAGNSYWFKERDGSQFLSHYAYRPDGTREWYALDKADVVHFRNGLDPRNMRLGLAPLSSVMREIFGDNEAATLEAALVHNCAIPGLIFSPANVPGASGQVVKIDEKGREALIKQLEEGFTGDNVGRPLVPPYPVDVQRLSLTPQELSMRELRMGKEERISGAMGLHPILAGFAAGLERSTYSNTEQAWKQGYEGNIIPTLRDWEDTLDDDLLQEFDLLNVLDVQFDFKAVACLQEDQDKAAKRVRDDYIAGVCTRAEARSARNYEAVTPRDDVFVAKVLVLPADQHALPPGDPGADEDPDGNDPGKDSGKADAG